MRSPAANLEWSPANQAVPRQVRPGEQDRATGVPTMPAPGPRAPDGSPFKTRDFSADRGVPREGPHHQPGRLDRSGLMEFRVRVLVAQSVRVPLRYNSLKDVAKT